MRNRAKCRLCQDIIESYHSTDHVVCNCGQIEVFEGPAMRCASKDWSNFLRVDDLGNEIVVTIKDDSSQTVSKPDRDELMTLLDSSIKAYENLPERALLEPVTHADMLNFMMIIQAILKE